MLSKRIPILLLSRDHVLHDKERRSKLLAPESELYHILEAERTRLVEKYGDKVAPKRMNFHIELIGGADPWSSETVTDRAKNVHGKCIDLQFGSTGNNKAYVVHGPIVPGYGRTHITVAYFPDGIPFPVLTEFPSVTR